MMEIVLYVSLVLTGFFLGVLSVWMHQEPAQNTSRKSPRKNVGDELLDDYSHLKKQALKNKAKESMMHRNKSSRIYDAEIVEEDYKIDKIV
tara:strand:+ start:5114 stop:5386 length:273 start_codon:yes stop_codon:yes gene_type:complete